MWIVMNNSFLSIVKDRDKKDRLLVRARVEGDIERVFPKAKVKTNLGSDYKYRAFIPKCIVSKAIKKSIENIDYDNFKNSVPLDDSFRHDVYLEVWSKLLALQHGKNQYYPYNMYQKGNLISSKGNVHTVTR